ncbi:hypothetical protein [Methylobacterium longum]|uniref:Arc-like DNA binding domain-containing protein n=1 Tax=Methylobacterium longum TaxID=767694 RepID=A0ABT8ASR1_9HYPH|nr:hypothetical protein [Methylobacterium longum]MDN3572947.1 hypothetical protein [Methylobacterium longum]GJE14569.1 hypothetical protein FOHLNKBM_5644 [Methylobacterium longum]
MSEAEAQKKIGRPAKNPGEGKRPTITFRCRGPLHERIQASAREADRSVSEEVETRLDRSYLADDQHRDNQEVLASITQRIVLDVLHDYVGGKHNFNAGQRFAHALKYHQAEADAKFRSEDPWYIDADKKKYIRDKVSDLVGFIIDELADETDPEEAERRRKALEDFTAGRGGLSALGQGYLGPSAGNDAKD